MLLTIQQLRHLKNQITERELLDRCSSAARLELRGSMYSSEDRQDCAAQIMTDGLTELKGAMPTATDPRHSLNAYCGRAKNIRRSMIRDRERDQAESDAQQDERAWSVDALTPEMPDIVTEADAWTTVESIVARLGLDAADKNVRTLVYGYVRDLPGVQIAAELEITPNSYDVRVLRGKGVVRDAFPTADAFLAALCGESVQSIDPLTGEPVLRFSLTDDSKAAHDRTHILSVDAREGTDAGSWPEKPATADDARRACEVRHRAPQKVSRESSPQIEADALKRLGKALAAER